MNVGSSWNKANTFIKSIWDWSDYNSFSTHGGTWVGPPFKVKNYMTHGLNPAYPALPLPNGDTDYDDALI
jgi:hypothetical protein